MNVLYSLSLLSLLTLSSVSSFSISQQKPSSGSVSLKEGQGVKLWCNMDDWWEWCRFTHVDSGKVCDFEWRKDVYNVTVLKCGDFEGRAKFIGSYNKYECGLELVRKMIGSKRGHISGVQTKSSYRLSI